MVKDNPGVKECCRLVKNLDSLSPKVRQCRVCGCKHHRLHAEPFSLPMKMIVGKFLEEKKRRGELTIIVK